MSETGGIAGDLIIKITVKEDPYFKREGFDLLTDAVISVPQAVLGENVQIRTLKGFQTIKIQPGS